IVVATPFLLTTMAWVGFVRVWRDGKVPRWRFWTSLCGCVALSVALAVPWMVILFSMFRLYLFDWGRLIVWCLAAGLVALIAGILSPKSLRFPLIFGGLITGGIAL